MWRCPPPPICVPLLLDVHYGAGGSLMVLGAPHGKKVVAQGAPLQHLYSKGRALTALQNRFEAAELV
jgi:hypothetical protein